MAKEYKYQSDDRRHVLCTTVFKQSFDRVDCLERNLLIKYNTADFIGLIRHCSMDMFVNMVTLYS